jgi:asparagine synthase (glutamine-hydrolysing)
MCGIIGGVNQEIDISLLDMIKHRGPDRQDIYEDIRNQNSVWLGHARLSIVDLTEAGNQPMISECGNYILVFNGEIYNHLELRSELKFNTYRGHSDTETLLYYLIEKGKEGLNDLNGIFSFAFYDKRKRNLLLVRDRFGVKPLYYFIENDKIMFSSEIRPLKKILNPEIFLDGLSTLLQLRYIPSPFTLHRGIMKIRPGHYLEIDISDDRLMHNIVHYDIPEINPLNVNFDEAVNLYEEYFCEAVKRQLMSDVDIGVFLSGGIDSAMVAYVASKFSSQKIKSFTVGYDSNYNVNEIQKAAETAKYLNIEHNYFRMNGNNFFEIFEECVKIIEEPLATTSVIPMYYLSKLAADKVKVVLTGQGADEPLGGYGRYQGELIKMKYPDVFIKMITFFSKIMKIKNSQIIRGTNSLTIDNELDRFLNIYNIFTPKEIENLTGSKCILPKELLIYFYENLKCSKEDDSVSRMMSIDMRMNLADDLLLYTDKITMNFSLECRVPILDYELIKYLNNLPTHYKVRLKKTKIIHKAYAKNILPKEIIMRPKSSFSSPANVWFREKMDMIEDMLLSSSSPMSNFFNVQYIKNILSEHNIGYKHERKIFLLVSIYYWLVNSE